MRHSKTVRRQSGGFTLIELIVVIGIIALLAGLLLSVVVKVREAGPRVQTKADIAALETGIAQFKSTYQVNYIPHGLVLTTRGNFNPMNPAHKESRDFISKVWPKAAMLPNSFFDLPPANDQISGQPIKEILLDGNQVLVFLLGGIPPGPNLPGNGDEYFTITNLPAGQYSYPFPPYFAGNYSGFFNSPSMPLNQSGNPAYGAVQGDQAKGPFVEFKLNRLQGGHYLDVYGNPFVYFSSKNGNDYSAFGTFAGTIPTYTNDGGWGPGTNNTSIKPFRGRDGRFINPNGFQIISSGRDRRFGGGGLGDVGGTGSGFESGMGDYSPGAVGGDDIANFGGATLGSN